jgi:hypothetical protein
VLLLFSLLPPKTTLFSDEMSKVGGGRRDRAPISVLPESRLRNEEAADKIRKLLVPEGQEGAVAVKPATLTPATTVPGRTVLFTSFVAAGLVPPFSAFFMQVLETYGIQMAHLSPNSVVALAVFAHLCEMFVGVVPSATLLRHFFVLRPVGKKRGHSTADVAGCCNLRLREGLGDHYIPQVMRSKWEEWRRDWFFVDIDPHERLELPEKAAEPRRSTWEAPPPEDARLKPVLERILELRESGLTSVMVVADFLRRRLAPLRERARPSWFYTGPEDITRTQIGASWDLGQAELRGMIRVITGSEDMSRAELPWPEMALCANPDRVAILKRLPEFDAQGPVDRPRSRSPEASELPGLEDLLGEEGVGSAAQAGDGAAATSSRRAGEEAAPEAAAESTPGDRGKRPRNLILPPESPPSPTAAAAFPVLEPRLVRMGPAPTPATTPATCTAESETRAAAPEARAVAQPSPQRKRRREGSGPTAPDPDIRLPAAKWRYR